MSVALDAQALCSLLHVRAVGCLDLLDGHELFGRPLVVGAVGQHLQVTTEYNEESMYAFLPQSWPYCAV